MHHYEDPIGKRIWQNFGFEKVIIGVKNPNLSIKFLRSYIWAIPLIPTLGILSNIYNFFLIFTIQQFILLMIGFVIALLTTVITFLGSFYELSIENNFIIFKNKLKIIKCIDISKYPRIYIRQRFFTSYSAIVASRGRYPFSEHEEYIVYIEQNDIIIQFPVKIKGVEQFIDNFITQSLQNLTREEKEKSISNEEKLFFDMQKICKKGRVIGVKDNSQNLKIKHGSNKNTIALYILLVFSLAMIILCTISKIYEVVIAFTLLIILFIALLIREQFKNTLRISYYEDKIIQINRNIFDYKNDILKLEIRAIQIPFKKEKYNYSLTLHTSNDSDGLFLNGVEEEKFTMFIKNLIFEESNQI